MHQIPTDETGDGVISSTYVNNVILNLTEWTWSQWIIINITTN